MMRGSSSRPLKRRRTTSRALGGSSVVPVTAARAEMNLAKKVMRLERVIKTYQPEMKFADLSQTSVNVNSATGLQLSLSAIAQGALINDRIGDKIMVKLIEFHVEAVYSGSVASSTTDNPSWRVYIVKDTQQIADTAPAGSDLVDQPSLPMIQLMNNLTQKRFVVLYDSGPQLLQAGTVAAPAAGNAMPYGKWHLHIKKRVNIPVQFNGTTTNDIQKNGISAFVFTDMTGAAGANVFDINATSRIGFTDM